MPFGINAVDMTGNTYQNKCSSNIYLLDIFLKTFKMWIMIIAIRKLLLIFEPNFYRSATCPFWISGFCPATVVYFWFWFNKLLFSSQLILTDQNKQRNAKNTCSLQCLLFLFLWLSSTGALWNRLSNLLWIKTRARIILKYNCLIKSIHNFFTAHPDLSRRFAFPPTHTLIFNQNSYSVF